MRWDDVWRRVRNVSPMLILAIGWCVLLIHAYPGLMTRDSFDQLAQARSGVYSDDHPPLMQLILGITDRFIAGPFGIVLLQSSSFMAGLYLLLRRVVSDRRAAIITVAFLWFPPVMAVMVVMWKDPLMAGALMLATALILSPRRGVRLWALVLALVATGVRFNALAATFGIIVLLFEWVPPHPNRWRALLTRYGLALAVWLATTAGAFAINAAIADRETHFWYTSLPGDIGGTLTFVNGERSDSSLRRLLEGTGLRHHYGIHAAIRKSYRSESALDYLYGDLRVWDIPLTGSMAPEMRAALYRAWKTIIVNNPVAYIRFRLDRFRVVLGLTSSDENVWDLPIIVTHPYQDMNALREAGIPTSSSALQSCIDDVLTWFSHTPLFRPYVYLIVAFLLLGLARRNQLVLALLLSGIGVELSLFFLAHSMDYRYSHWMVCTTVLAAVLLFVDRWRRRTSALDLGT